MLIAAISPAVVLGYYIYKKDKLRQEPPKELLKAFGLEAPSSTELLHELNIAGEKFSLPCLDNEECIRLILDYYKSI